MCITKIKKFFSKWYKQKENVDFFSDCLSALNGDPGAITKITCTLASTPFLLREKMLWRKFELFLNGISVSQNSLAEFRRKLTEEGKEDDNPYRLLEAIDRCDTKRKIDYLISASICFTAGTIDSPAFFRMVQIIKVCLQEDLEFAAQNIKNKGQEYEINANVLGLVNCGLMHQISYGGPPAYVFTEFAEIMDEYCLNHEDTNRFLNPRKYRTPN